MFDLEVFDVSILTKLRVSGWSQIAGLGAASSAAKTTITPDGHWVLWGEPIDSIVRTKIFSSIKAARSGEEETLVSGFYLHLFYGDRSYEGSLLHLEPFTYSEERLPEVFGNWEDQEPGLTTLTIVAKKRTLDVLFDKWKSCVSRRGGGGKSTFRVACSGAAAQAAFDCKVVSIEDLIDFYVAAAFAIKMQRNSRMIVGRTYTHGGDWVEGAPITFTQVSVEGAYGPFEEAWLRG
jgi:hypothetical protein